MPCLCCHSSSHDTYDCTSVHARTMDETVSHWLLNRLRQFYSTSECMNSSYFLAISQYFTQLSKGDLLYLLRDVLVDDPGYVVERLIYIYIHYTIWTFYQIYKIEYSEKIRQIIQADIQFWYHLSNGIHTVNESEEIRKTRVKPPYDIVEQPHTNECIQCPVCWNEEITKKNTHEYNCRHSLCLICSHSILESDNLKCPLCREPIETVYEFIL